MKQLPDALIIVDMQDYFLRKFKTKGVVNRLVKAVNKQITWAMKHNVPIIVLEYDTKYAAGTHCRTNWLIRQHMRFYKRKWYVFKDENDGSDEVLEVMHGCEPRIGLVEPHRLENLAGRKDTFKFLICGVNLDACVHDTVEGLQPGHTVAAVESATRNAWDNKTPSTTRGEFSYGLLMKQYPNNCKVVKKVA